MLTYNDRCKRRSVVLKRLNKLFPGAKENPEAADDFYEGKYLFKLGWGNHRDIWIEVSEEGMDHLLAGILIAEEYPELGEKENE